MPAIALVVELQLTAGSRDRFIARANEHRDNVLTHEPGCQRFDILVPDESADLVLLYEVYADEAALETHFNTSYMREYLADTGPMVAQRTRRRCSVLGT